MKKKLLLLVAILLSFFMFGINAKAQSVNVYVFHSNTCEHCKAAISYLQSIKEKYDLNIYKYEVQDNDTTEKIKVVEKYFDVSITGVPVVVINNRHIRGYSESTNDIYIYNIKQAQDDSFIDEVGIKLGVVDKKIVEERKNNAYKISFLGKSITLNKKDILKNTFILGFVKAFNPVVIISSLTLILMILLLGKDYKYAFLGIIIDFILYFILSSIVNIDGYKLLVLSKLIISILLIGLSLYKVNEKLCLYNINKINNKWLSVLVLIIFFIFISLLKVFVIGFIPSLLVNATIIYKVVYALCNTIISTICILFMYLIIKVSKLDKYKYNDIIFSIILLIFSIILIIKPAIIGL